LWVTFPAPRIFSGIIQPKHPHKTLCTICYVINNTVSTQSPRYVTVHTPLCASYTSICTSTPVTVNLGVTLIPEIPENPENFPKNLSDGISGNFGKFFPGIPGNSGNPRELFRKFGGFFQNARCGTGYTMVNRGENLGKSGKFSPKTCRTEFPGISGNFFRGFPGILEIPGTFPEIWGFFPERALWNSVHVGKTG
jgi:hypothetical protein